MISKERLQELIKQEATIWVENQYCNAYAVELSHYYYVAITDNKESLMFLDYSIQEDDPESVLIDYLENLYEAKEDAEWASIATYRTEIFAPPTYEEMIKEPRCLDCWTKEFVVMDNDKPIGIAFIGVDFDCEIVSVEMGSDKYFVERLTKDNYIKACTIARKLFLGESIEEGENDEESKN